MRVVRLMFNNGCVFTYCRSLEACFPLINRATKSLMYLYLLANLSKVGQYALGAAKLAILYRYLYRASKKGIRVIGGFLPLLQVWIYERILPLRPRRDPNLLVDEWLISILPGPPCARVWSNGLSHDTKVPHLLYLFLDQLNLLIEHQVHLTMDPDGSSSQPLGDDAMGVLLAQFDALSRDLTKVRMDVGDMRGYMGSMKGNMIRMKVGVDRLCPPKPPHNPSYQVQSPQTREVQRPLHQELNQVQQKGLGTQILPQNPKYKVPNSLDQRLYPSQVQTPQVQRSYISQNLLTLLHKLESKENEAKPQDGEKIDVEVQEHTFSKNNPKGVPHTHMVDELIEPLAESSNLGTSDEEINPRGHLDIFHCDVGHEGLHGTKSSAENTSHDLQGNKAIFYTPKNLNCCDVASSSQSGLVSDWISEEVYESPFCDTFGVNRLHKDQTLVVSAQALVDLLDDKINSFRKNDLCPSSARTYNLNKGVLCDISSRIFLVLTKDGWLYSKSVSPWHVYLTYGNFLATMDNNVPSAILDRVETQLGRIRYKAILKMERKPRIEHSRYGFIKEIKYEDVHDVNLNFTDRYECYMSTRTDHIVKHEYMSYDLHDLNLEFITYGM
ncbi:hypothetical protein FXO38_18612 [Capsicum annuum]|nr:hypothetical protein FXO38_18612 [Capsicum annuum]